MREPFSSQKTLTCCPPQAEEEHHWRPGFTRHVLYSPTVSNGQNHVVAVILLSFNKFD